MNNIKLILEYDGTNYHGWQSQINAISIQDKIESVLEKILGEKIRLNVSGRTDTGVHAINQVVNFKTSNSKLLSDKLMIALNGLLPDDIVVKNATIVAADFDARRSAKGKIYRYVILNRKAPSALERFRCWHVRQPLNIDLMNECAALIVGEHDFSSFRGSGCGAKHAVRRVLNASFSDKGDGFIYFEIEGYGFLRHMVRNIVGTLVYVGLGKISFDEFKKILPAKDRTVGGLNAPSQGLFLLEVKYDIYN